MGVRGLTSVLAEDARRFGAPWSLGGGGGIAAEPSSASAGTAVYIDGPALLHHLLAAYPGRVAAAGRGEGAVMATVQPAPAGLGPHLPSLFGQASPEAVYALSAGFGSALLSSGASEVHLVLDGAASRHKSVAQLERMVTAATRAERAALAIVTGEGSSSASALVGAWDVPHLFAERSMADAFTDVGCAVRRSRGEAEGGIARLVADLAADGRASAVVLSNDSDFLVYPSCPGYVPLHSLQFELISSGEGEGTAGKRPIYRVTGWQYSRGKFLAAFPMLVPHGCGDGSGTGTDMDADGTFGTMCAVSALAGNDYALSTPLEAALRSARTAVVRSDIGGLRRRERNDPTARGAVTAVIRYVGHFAVRSGAASDGGGNTWLQRLVAAVAGDGKGREDREARLTEAISLVQSIYASDAERGAVLEKGGLDSDGLRLLSSGTFYCRPVVEFGPSNYAAAGGIRKKKRRVVNTRRNQKAGRKARDRTEAVPRNGNTALHNVGVCESSSMWMEPRFSHFRRRLYQIIHRPRGQEEVNSTIEEHCRTGSGNQILYQRSEVPAEPFSNIWDLVSRENGDTPLWGLMYCFTGCGALDDSIHLQTAAMPDPFISMSALLLSSCQERLLLLMMSSVSLCDPRSNSGEQLNFRQIATMQEPVDRSTIKAMTRVQLAIFHAVFAANLLSHRSSDHDPLMPISRGFRPSSFFQDELALVVWTSIVEEFDDNKDAIDIDRFVDDIPLNSIFGRIEGSLNESTEAWRSRCAELWRTLAVIAKCEKDQIDSN